MREIEAVIDLFDASEEYAEESLTLLDWQAKSWTVQQLEENVGLRAYVKGYGTSTADQLEEFLAHHFPKFFVVWFFAPEKNFSPATSQSKELFGTEATGTGNLQRELQPKNFDNQPSLHVQNIVAKSLPSYALPMLETDPQKLKEIVEHSPDFLTQVMASWVLHQANQPFLVDEELHPENIRWLEQEKADYENRIENYTKSYLDQASKNSNFHLLNLYSDNILSQFCLLNQQFLSIVPWDRVPRKEQKRFAKATAIIQDYVNGKATPDEVSEAIFLLRVNIEILQSYCQQHGIESKAIENNSVLVWQKYWTKWHKKNRKNIAWMLAKKEHASEFAGLQEIEFELLSKRKALNLFQQRKKQTPHFEEQNLQGVFDNVCKNQKRHVLFSKSLFKDGMSYVNLTPRLTKKEVYVFQNICNSQSLTLFCADKFSSLNAQYQSLPKAAQTFFNRKFLSSDSYAWRDKFEVSLDPSEDLKQSLENALVAKYETEIKSLSKHKAEQKEIQLFAQKFFDMVSQFLVDSAPRTIEETTSVEEGINSTGQQITLQGNLFQEHDKALQQKLQNRGAVLEENLLDLPNYRSWTSLSSGVCYRIEQDNLELTYVPVEDIAFIKKGTEYKIDVKKHAQTLQSRFLQQFEGLMREPSDFVCIGTKTAKGKITFYEMVDLKNPTLSASLKNGLKGHLEGTLVSEEAIRNFLPIPTDQELVVSNIEGEGAKFIKSSLTAGHFQKLGDKYLPGSFGLNKALSFLKAVQAKDTPCVLSQRCFEPRDKQAWHGLLEEKERNRSEREFLRISHAFGLLDGLASEEQIEDVFGNTAPRSEKGRLIVKHKQEPSPAALEKALELLKDLDVVEEVYRDVPWNILPGDKHCVSPLHPHYMKSLEQPLIPIGYGVIHGLTGSGDHGSVANRLKSIIQTGGLYSIATRRHLGLQVESLSPVGDIASGIDHGVPTTLANRRAHGNDIFFLFKDSVLSRRDLWFAPRDFGGGHDRMGSYDQYAKELGYKGFRYPPPPQARDRHLRRLENNQLHLLNEVYFEDGISLNEIDTIFLIEDLKGPLQQHIKKWIQNGDLPTDINIRWIGLPRDLQREIWHRTNKIRGFSKQVAS